MGIGNWAIAAVGTSAARPDATIKAATIDGLPVPAIDPSIIASCRRYGGAPGTNYGPIIAFVRWPVPVAPGRQQFFFRNPRVARAQLPFRPRDSGGGGKCRYRGAGAGAGA